jgi:hypothetical protein
MCWDPGLYLRFGKSCKQIPWIPNYFQELTLNEKIFFWLFLSTLNLLVWITWAKYLVFLITKKNTFYSEILNFDLYVFRNENKISQINFSRQNFCVECIYVYFSFLKALFVLRILFDMYIKGYFWKKSAPPNFFFNNKLYTKHLSYIIIFWSLNKHIHGFAIFQPNNVNIIVPLTLKRKYYKKTV